MQQVIADNYNQEFLSTTLTDLIDKKRRVFPLLERIFSNSYASFLAQLDYWMNLSKKIKDGRKYFWKTYEQWSEELNLSVSTIRRIVSFFKQLKIIEVERLSSQTWYQANWYSLSYDKLQIILDQWHEGMRSLEQIIMFKAIASICSSWSLHILDSTSKNSPHSLEGEKEEISSHEKLPQVDSEHEIIADRCISDIDQTSAVCSLIPKTRSTEAAKREKYVWEIEINHPYPVFLNWWADTKYKPQGGRWEADAYGCAYSEFYKSPQRTEVAIYPQFLEYLNRVSENCNQLQVNDMQAALPSCFIAKPEPTQQNTEVLMSNVATLVERGVTVALPQKIATPSCQQTMLFDEAQTKQAIAPLAELKAIAPAPQKKLRSCTLVDIQELNRWLQGTEEVLKKEAVRIAKNRNYELKYNESRIVVEVIESAKLEPDWKAVTENTLRFEQQFLEDVWDE